MADEPQAQPAPGQDQQPAPTTPAPAAPVIGDGPWRADLEALIEDPTYRAKVDQFLRDKVQPHTTKLEQQVAAQKDAVRLYSAFEEDSTAAYVAVTNDLFGEERAQEILAYLQQHLGATPAPEQIPGQTQMPLDPRMQQAIDYVENQQNEAFYAKEIARVTEANPDVVEHLLHPFVAAANGDFDQAVELYHSAAADFASRFTNQPEGEPAPVAPAVVGSDTATAQASTTPVEPKKQTMNEAIDSFMAEQRANREAPPVGTV